MRSRAATVQEPHGRGPCRSVRDPPVDSAAMCGRFTQQRPTSEIAAIFEAEDLFDDPGGRFNVAPDGRGGGRRPAR